MRRQKRRTDERFFDEVFEEEFQKDWGMSSDEAIEFILGEWEKKQGIDISIDAEPDENGMVDLNSNEAAFVKYLGEEENKKPSRFHDGLIR